MGNLTCNQLISLLQSDPFDSNQITIPDNMTNLLIENDNNNVFIGHIIANMKEQKTLLNFFDLVETTARELVPEVSTQLGIYNHTIGHYIACYHKPEALDKFLQLVATHAPKSLEKVLTQTDLITGRTMGHMVARYQKLEALEKFLQAVVKHAPFLLEKVLTETIDPANNIIGIIISNKSGSAIYHLLKHKVNLQMDSITQLASMKEQVLEHMRTLPLEEQISSYENALDKTHPLGILFHVQRGFFPPRKENGTLQKIAQRYSELTLSTPSNHVQMSIFNTTSSETAAGRHMDTETFNLEPRLLLSS